MKKNKIYGEYSEREYIIFKDGVEIYRAGNSPYDSTQYVPLDEGVGLEVMKDYCTQTAKELCAEHGAEFDGVTYDEYLNDND